MQRFAMRKLIAPAAAVLAVGYLGAIPLIASAQTVQRSAAIASSDVLSQISMFNYRSGRKSDLLLRPTPIVASGAGEVQVEFQNGNAQILAEVERLPPPTALGPYTTYVLWALTPDGRAANEGVLAGAAGGSGAIETQHGGSQFALIVTAEPHFAVSAPSTMIVLYNVAEDVKGQESKVTSLTERADYSALAPITVEAKTRPVEVVQAEYAVAIARAAGAERYATRPYAIAQEKLAAARVAASDKRSSERRTAPGLAREAVIAGEDARRAAMVAKTDADADARREAAVAAAASAERERAAAAAAEAALAAEAAAEAGARAAAEAAEARATEAARADLRNRLNSVLPTRESNRGLVSEIGGVQFATATADLNSTARESLAKFSGIVASYPDLSFTIEGHTDNTGSDATNNELSYRRAIAVRDYLIGQGVPASRIDVEGLGSARPLADNSTADGRARNRRVEMVLSGGLLSAR